MRVVPSALRKSGFVKSMPRSMMTTVTPLPVSERPAVADGVVSAEGEGSADDVAAGVAGEVALAIVDWPGDGVALAGVGVAVADGPPHAADTRAISTNSRAAAAPLMASASCGSGPILAPSVNLASVSDLDYGDDRLRVIDAIDDAEVALAEPVFLLATQLLVAIRAGIVGEGVDADADAVPILGR
jgi:hypothetical protein